MAQAPDQDATALAGLAAANGPWLAARLHRLAELAGQHLDPDVVDAAVEGASRVLGQVMAAEGRPAEHLGEADDPAVVLGSEQALSHQQAGLSMPESLKVQRLLRRAYDDLVRESWVERDTRARAHEDVERFFERALAGLVSAWTGQVMAPPKADESQAELLAQREEQLRRTRETAQKLTLAARNERDRADALEVELAQAKSRTVQSLAKLKTEFVSIHARALEKMRAEAQAQAQAERQALNEHVRGLEIERDLLAGRLAEAEQAQAASAELETACREAAAGLIQARHEADQAQAEVEQLRAELQKRELEAASLQSEAARASEAAQAVEAAGVDIGPLRDELRQLRQTHAALADEAEAMRARLAETGSRLAVVRLAEGEENLARLHRATEELAQARERVASLEEQLAQASQERLEGQERMAALEEQLAEREAAHLAEGIRAAGEAQDRLDAQARTNAELAARAEALEAARTDLAEQLKLAAEQLEQTGAQQDALLAEARARIQALEAERLQALAEAEALAVRLKEAETQVVRLAEDQKGMAAELSLAQSRAVQADAQAQAHIQTLESQRAERDAQTEQLKKAEAQVVQLAEELVESARALNAARARTEESEADAQTRAENLAVQRAERDGLAERLKEAEAQAVRLSEELFAAREQLAASDIQRMGAERRAEDALAQGGEAVLEAKAQIKACLDEQAAAREAGARLLAAHLELTPDAVAAIDAAGVISAWNKRFGELFELTEAELAQGMEAVLPLLAERIQRPEAFVSRVGELLASPYLAEDGMPLATIRGETLVFRSAPVKPLEGDGEENGGQRLLHFRDVSLEHDMEQLLREIEGSTRAELGQPLTAFIHMPQELLDDPSITPDQAKKLAVIRDSGYRIVNTVNMAVDIFRMERGLYHSTPGRSLDLAVAARRAARDVAPLAAVRRVTIVLLLNQEPLPSDASLPAPGDPILAHALAVNLLRDALEAAPRGSVVSAALRQEGSSLRLEITRPGALDADGLSAYFDKPLSQGPDHGLRRARHAAQLIARNLGSSLDVRSAENAGVTVSLLLPA